MVDADDADTDGVAGALLEVTYLLYQIANDPVDLFDHRLCQDFHLTADFNCRNRAAGDLVTGVTDGHDALRYRADDSAHSALCSVQRSGYAVASIWPLSAGLQIDVWQQSRRWLIYGGGSTCRRRAFETPPASDKTQQAPGISQRPTRRRSGRTCASPSKRGLACAEPS